MTEKSKYANISFLNEKPKKTPMEILIEEMEQLKKTKLYEGSFKGIDDCIYLATANLEIEKKEIVNIANLAYSCHDKNIYYRSGEDFINSYFKNHLK
jgi:hypothetical protein